MGDMAVEITIVRWDPDWPGRFAAEAERLRAALGDAAVRIEHVGSTAVPGLAAKPVIDVQISVRSLRPARRYRVPLEALGYAYTPHYDDFGEDRLPFFGRPRRPPRSFHVHVCEAESEDERRHLAFRDWLVEHPEDARAYEMLKRELARRRWRTRDDYAKAKSRFVATIVARASGRAGSSPDVPARSRTA